MQYKPNITRFVAIMAVGLATCSLHAVVAKETHILTEPVAEAARNLRASDARLKRDVHTLHVGLEEIMQLEAVTFYWNEKVDDRRRQFGFIAQQVQSVLPELVVKGNDSEGTLKLDYEELIPILVSAVQDLKAENDLLQAQIDLLSEKLQ